MKLACSLARLGSPFKEEQRLDWQQKYLTQLCEADQEIQEAYELVTHFTSMLRERLG